LIEKVETFTDKIKTALKELREFVKESAENGLAS
jgi:hypothetical protein